MTASWLAASVAAGRPLPVPPPPSNFSAVLFANPVAAASAFCSLAFAPLPHALPLRDFLGSSSGGGNGEQRGQGGMRQVKLCASGLPTAARHAAAQLGEALGARYSDCMRASTTHLLVPTRSGEKFDRAAEFGVVSFFVFF